MSQHLITIAAIALIITTSLIYISKEKNPSNDSPFGVQHQNFIKQLKTIANKVNNKKGSTWKAGENQRWNNMDIDSIKRQMGSLDKESSGLNLPIVNTVRSDLPQSYDARTAFPNCESLKEVRDQANCGSCWAFSAAQVMSDRICIASKQTRQDRISTQDLLTCCSDCGFGCSGGWSGSAFNYYITTGLVTGDLYNDDTWCRPYSLAPCDHHTEGQYNPCGATVSTPKCEKSCVKNYWRSYNNDQQFGQSAYNVESNEQAIMTEILTHGPVSASFQVYEDFLTYQNGIYKHEYGSGLGGHAVKIIGWGEEQGFKYWIIVNSWNEDWGNKGVFFMIRGENECGIEGNIVAGIPQLF